MSISRRKRRNKRRTQTLLIAVVIFELIVFMAGCVTGCQINKPKNIVPENTVENGTETENNNEPVEVEKTVADEMIEEMSLSDMVYQMMFVTPEEITKVDAVIKAGDTTKDALGKYPVGGIVYATKNFDSREQTIQMINKSQEYSEVPMFIAVEEEGGRVASLGENSDMETTKIGTMKSIGKTKDSKKAYEAGKTLGSDLKALGFNVNLAPNADILTNSDNTEIGDRSFGSDPEIVSEMVEQVVKGMKEKGVTATLKYFPGYGGAEIDSDTGIAESSVSPEDLRKNEFLPFKTGISAGADFVMISHMVLTKATEEKVPSSLSKEVITDMLINELGFKGIVITDSFKKSGITENYTSSEAAIKAIQAGADMIYMPEDVEKVHDAIVDAVEDGKISEERIIESVRKILTLKNDMGIIE